MELDSPCSFCDKPVEGWGLQSTKDESPGPLVRFNYPVCESCVATMMLILAPYIDDHFPLEITGPTPELARSKQTLIDAASLHFQQGWADEVQDDLDEQHDAVDEVERLLAEE